MHMHLYISQVIIFIFNLHCTIWHSVQDQPDICYQLPVNHLFIHQKAPFAFFYICSRPFVNLLLNILLFCYHSNSNSNKGAPWAT